MAILLLRRNNINDVFLKQYRPACYTDSGKYFIFRHDIILPIYAFRYTQLKTIHTTCVLLLQIINLGEK